MFSRADVLSKGVNFGRTCRREKRVAHFLKKATRSIDTSGHVSIKLFKPHAYPNSLSAGGRGSPLGHCEGVNIMNSVISSSGNEGITTRPIRRSISSSDEEVAVFTVDVLSQPHYRTKYTDYDPLVHTKCSRALPVALSSDVVVLSGSLDREYYEWLRGLGLGPDTVVEYHQETAKNTLSELILASPNRVKKAIRATGRRPIVVPFYSGESEQELCRLLDADLFGCDEKVILKYFNKESFKAECVELGIPMVGGANARVDGSKRLKESELADIVLTLLNEYPKLIIRGAEGSAGSSLYTLDKSNVLEVYRQVRRNQESSLLVEPFLKVIASPNDQYVIGRNGELSHLGISSQLFEGLKHTGNLFGQYLSPRIEEYIKSTSATIVHSMAAHGYRGVVGIDYIVSSEGIFPVENNARMNGSSFTLGIIDHLADRHGSIPTWKFYKGSTQPCTFKELVKRIEPVLYNGSGINCVFPYDCDTLAQNGKFTPVLVAEDMYHIDYLERALDELGVEKI